MGENSIKMISCKSIHLSELECKDKDGTLLILFQSMEEHNTITIRQVLYLENNGVIHDWTMDKDMDELAKETIREITTAKSYSMHDTMQMMITARMKKEEAKT